MKASEKTFIPSCHIHGGSEVRRDGMWLCPVCEQNEKADKKRMSDFMILGKRLDRRTR